MAGEDKNIAALYCRVSKDDETIGDSGSIKTQREMLKRFAEEKGFIIFDYYIDDGYSGTNFNRPSIKRMINDIKEKKINIVIVKDFSRLGRNQTDYNKLIEIFFPQNNIRFISINNDYDSKFSSSDDAMRMHNFINEFYARDVSKKIKSAFATKMKAGKYIGNFAPYGYLKSSEDKNKLVINKETEPIVKKIFNMAMENKTPSEIARRLNEDNIESPAVYKCRKNPQCNIDSYSKSKKWTSGGVQKILKNIVYIGCLEQHKTTTIGFGIKLQTTVAKSERYIVEDTHEAIIDKDVFEVVQKKSKSRRNCPKTNFVNVFSGVAKCADCSCNMSSTASRKKGSKYNLECGKYKLHGSKACTNHFVDYNYLYKIVLDEINSKIKFTEEEQEAIIKKIKLEEKNAKSKDYDSNMTKLKNRKNEINQIINKIYEDKYLNKISEERFNSMVKNYEIEENSISLQLKEIENENAEPISKKFEYFFDLIKGQKEIKVLTPEIVASLIDEIKVYQGEYKVENGKKKKTQKIEIKFKFIGNTDIINELENIQ